MRWVLRLFGFPVVDLSASESDEAGWGYHTAGQFEVAQEPSEGYYGDSEPEFGFRGPS